MIVPPPRYEIALHLTREEADTVREACQGEADRLIANLRDGDENERLTTAYTAGLLIGVESRLGRIDDQEDLDE